MDNRYYDLVIEEMKPFFEEQGFRADGECFINEKKAVKVEYDEALQQYKLFGADVTDGTVGEFSLLSGYLFDDSQFKTDAAAVGIDFVDTLKKNLGIRTGRTGAGDGVDLPTASKGSAVTVTTLVGRFLAVYPALKEDYKNETAKNGKFLYLDFCTRYVVPEMRKTLESGNKKSVKKLVDMLNDLYVAGDNATSTAVVVFLAAAIGKDEPRFRAAADQMENAQHLLTSVNNQIALLDKNKKFTAALNYQG